MSQLTLNSEIVGNRIQIGLPLFEISYFYNINYKDGDEIKFFESDVTAFSPGSDVSAAPAEVQSLATLLWTPEVVAAYEASLPQPEPEPVPTPEPELEPEVEPETEPEVEPVPEPEVEPVLEPEPEVEPEPEPEPNEEESN